MKKLVISGLLLGMLTGVGVAQRGRPIGPTARPNVDFGTRRSAGVPHTVAQSRTTVNRNVSPTVAPIRDPK